MWRSVGQFVRLCFCRKRFGSTYQGLPKQRILIGAMASRHTRSLSDCEGVRSETIEDAVKMAKSRRGVSVVSDFVRAHDEESDGSAWAHWKQKACSGKGI